MAKGHFRNWETYRCEKCGFSEYVKYSKNKGICPDCKIALKII